MGFFSFLEPSCSLPGCGCCCQGKRTIRPERNWLVRLTRLVVPIVNGYAGENLWVEQDGKWKATSLFVALVAVEAMDLVFAVDSVPGSAGHKPRPVYRLFVERLCNSGAASDLFCSCREFDSDYGTCIKDWR